MVLLLIGHGIAPQLLCSNESLGDLLTGLTTSIAPGCTINKGSGKPDVRENHEGGAGHTFVHIIWASLTLDPLIIFLARHLGAQLII